MYYYQTQTLQSSLLKTVVTTEYIPVDRRLIKWAWEDTVGSWGEGRHTYKGFVPYIMGKKMTVYIVTKSKSGTEMMSSILADDNSYRLSPEYYAEFGLTESIEPQIVK